MLVINSEWGADEQMDMKEMFYDALNAVSMKAEVVKHTEEFENAQTEVHMVQHTFERKVFEVALDKILSDVWNSQDPYKVYLRLARMTEPFFIRQYPDRMKAAKEMLGNPDHRWTKFLNNAFQELNHNVVRTSLLNFGYEGMLRGGKDVRANRKKYRCNVPYLVLFDPTSACNMHCEGCWSGTYGHKDNMPYATMDKIVSESKELGTHLFLMTGGEPMVRWKDIVKLARAHDDCMFGLFTNSTLVTEEVAKTCQELGNVIFFLSIEGTPDTNDARRGEGHYAAVMKAMDILRAYGILFGTSICYTKYNVEAVTSDDFYKLLEEKGARFGFYFHYMPVGQNAVPDLMPTVEQRKYMIQRIREVRSTDSDIQFFPMDFQNDGEFIGGCIAGGREYFHINAHGDAEPCVFIHYSDCNIYDNSILEMLQSPLFMAYREGQPFNKNHLRPCPMLENPDMLRELVSRTNAHDTNLEAEEGVDHLCDKCDDYASHWKPVADEVWNSYSHREEVYKDTAKRHVTYGVKETVSVED